MDYQNNEGRKTFFIVRHKKSFENLGIETEWENLDKMQIKIEEHWKEIGGAHFATICKSEKDNIHVHEVVTFENSIRPKAVAKLYGNAHVEDMKSTKKEAIAYIRKEGVWEEKGEIILREFGSIEEIKDNSGKRTDLKTFDLIAMKDGFNIDEYIINNYITEKTAKELEMRYNRLLKTSCPEWRNVEVIYVEGEAGSGKTRVAIENNKSYFVADVSKKTSFPFNGYKGEKTLILDELRPGVFTHGELMKILDGYKLNIDIKFGQTVARWEKVIIATAYPLKEWYKPYEGQGQDNYKRQFERRITKHMKAKNGIWEVYKEEENKEVKERLEENTQYLLDFVKTDINFNEL